MKWHSFGSERHLVQVGPGYWEDPWFPGVWKLLLGGVMWQPSEIDTRELIEGIFCSSFFGYEDSSTKFPCCFCLGEPQPFFWWCCFLIKPWILGIWTWRVFIAKHHGWAISPHSEIRRLNRFVCMHVSLNIFISTTRSGNGRLSNQYFLGRFFLYLHVGLWWFNPAILGLCMPDFDFGLFLRMIRSSVKSWSVTRQYEMMLYTSFFVLFSHICRTCRCFVMQKSQGKTLPHGYHRSYQFCHGIIGQVLVPVLVDSLSEAARLLQGRMRFVLFDCYWNFKQVRIWLRCWGRHK